MYSSIKTNDNFIKGVGVKPKIDEASYSVELPLVNQICFKAILKKLSLQDCGFYCSLRTF